MRTAFAVASLSGIKESAARSPPVGLLRAIADPRRRGRVAYGRQVEQDVQVEWTVKCNQSQRAVVEGLSLELEGIQGPPGTGKSQTIVAIIAQRLPQKEAVLVASMQNKVVDAIVTKLERHQESLGGGFYVLGAAANERIGAVAARFTLLAQIERDPDVFRCRKALEDLEARLEQSKTAQERDDWPTKESQECKENALEELRASKWAARKRILQSVRVIVGTIGASQSLYRKRHHADHYDMPQHLRIGTVILDEAGSVPEFRLPVLIALRPIRMILVGDLKQLPPFTSIKLPPGSADSSEPPQSLLKRVADSLGDGSLAMLRIQYRMHPAVASFVSMSFYNSELETDEETKKMRIAPGPLAWPGPNTSRLGYNGSTTR